ncbi:MAG: TolC family protein [Candidatus Thioglobus sp.]|nr:MAG: TolC family protein [Candidatus Thioglobus sp.]KAA0456385.1 MAG: TolC family protein [Candidatus Thioglobus sp.]
MKLFFAITLLFLAINTQALTEQSFVQQLKEAHPFFKQQALTSAVRQVEKRATTANQDWIIGINSDYQREKNAKDAAAIYDNLDTTSAGISATKKFTNTGSQFTLKHTWREKSKDLNTNRSQFSLDYNLPLLRNWGGINDRLGTDVADIEISKNSLERLEAEEAFMLKNLLRFFDLAYAQKQQMINKNRLELTQKELTLVQKKYASSVVEKVDVLLQKDAYQKAKQQLLQAQQELTLLRHEIAITLNIDFEQVVAQVDLYKTYNPKSIVLWTYLQKNSRVLKINKLVEKALNRQLLSFKNQSKVQLDLNLNLSSAGEDDSYSNSLEKQSSAWKVGLGLVYPLGSTKSNSDVEKVNIQLQSLKQSKHEQLLDIYTQAKTLKEKTVLLEEILASNEIQIKIAKERTIEEKQRYSNGNGQASFVINAQNNEQTAQLNYAQSGRNYQKSVLQFRAAIDLLIQ